jgi:hypothetical protein
MITNKTATLKFIFFFVFCLFLFDTNAQSVNGSETIKEHLSLQDQVKGIFQIQMVGVRTKPALTNELYERVLKEQKQSEQVSFMYTDSIRIVILSKDDINSVGRFSDDDLIIYTNH